MKQSVFIGALAAWLLRLLYATLRFRMRDPHSVCAPDFKPVIIFVIWHNRLLMGPLIRARPFRHRKLATLASMSKDGEVIAEVLRRFRFHVVRGSTSRRAAQALVELRRCIKNGEDVAITPDGPRGPRYQVQPGIVKLAQLTGAVVVPLHVRYSSYWELKSWDRFRIPKPFSHVEVTAGSAAAVQGELDEESFEQDRKALEKLMLEEGV